MRANRRAAYKLGLVLAIVLIAMTPFAIYFLTKLFIVADSNVKLGAITAIISVVALIYNNSRQQIREISSRHYTEKRESYRNFFDILFEFMQSSKTGREPDSSLERISDILKSIMIWGSSETINAYNAFMRHSTEQMQPGRDDDDAINFETFQKMESLLRNMRKDLGHSDRNLDRHALTKLFISADEHHKFD